MRAIAVVTLNQLKPSWNVKNERCCRCCSCRCSCSCFCFSCSCFSCSYSTITFSTLTCKLTFTLHATASISGGCDLHKSTNFSKFAAVAGMACRSCAR